MKYLFGPVNSRRLGLSQGIDLLPSNICNFNCIYCEVGATSLLTCERKEYFPTREIITEIDQLLAAPAAPAPDVFTITATGEPTLHSGLGAVVRFLKEKASQPVAVLTNGSLLHLAEVREELAAADIVIPSLDAALPRSFRRVNRPASCAELEQIVEGLVSFRRQFQGELWLEILLVKGVNDHPEDIAALQQAVARIRPDRVQLNTVARPPLEAFAAPLNQQALEKIAAQLPGRVEILVDFAKRERHQFRTAAADEILEMLRRRPCTLPDICEALNLDGRQAQEVIEQLVQAGKIESVSHNQKAYYQIDSQTLSSETGRQPEPPREHRTRHITALK